MALIIVGCGDDTPMTPAAAHAVATPTIVGTGFVRAGSDACWSVDVAGKTCNHGHRLSAVLAINDSTPGGSWGPEMEECWTNIEQTLEIYAQAKCTEGEMSEIAHVHVNLGR